MHQRSRCLKVQKEHPHDAIKEERTQTRTVLRRLERQQVSLKKTYFMFVESRGDFPQQIKDSLHSSETRAVLWHAERDVRIFSSVVLAHSWSIRFTLNSREEIRLAYSQTHIYSKTLSSRVGREDGRRSPLRWQSEEILSFVNQHRGGTETGRKEWGTEAEVKDKQVLALLYEFS